MTAALITGIVTLIISAGTAFGWYVKRKDAKSDPLPRSSAEVALAKEALGIVQASSDALKEDVERLRADRELDRQRIDALEANVVSLRQTWTSWYYDLRDRWQHHREQARPPEPPTLD